MQKRKLSNFIEVMIKRITTPIVFLVVPVCTVFMVYHLFFDFDFLKVIGAVAVCLCSIKVNEKYS